MVAWLSIISGAITIISTVVGILRDRKLIDGAMAEVVAVNLQGALDEIAKATAARDAVRAIPVERLRDPDPDSRD